MNNFYDFIDCIKKTIISFQGPFQSLYPHQEKLIHFLDDPDHRHVVFEKPRIQGYSTIVSLWAFWKFLNEDYSRVMYVAPSRRLSNIISEMFRRIIDETPEVQNWIQQRSLREITSKNGGRIYLDSWKSARGRSLGLLVIDEAASIRQFERCWKTINPCIQLDGKAVLFSSIDESKKHPFAEILMGAQEGKNRFSVFEA